MSNYSALIATINANIKANNNHEITGAITNSVLNAMVDSLGAGYQFMGVATPTNPGSAQTPDYKCFYLATTPGTYTYLGGLVVADGEVALLKYDSSWTKEVTGIASADKLNQLGQRVDEYHGRDYSNSLIPDSAIIVPTSSVEGDTIDITPTTITGVSCACIGVIEGERFIITGVGAQGPKLWAFLDKEYKLISKSGENETATNRYFDAPDEGFLVVNFQYNIVTPYIESYGVLDNIINVTDKYPLLSGYYTLTTAIRAVPLYLRKKGLIVTFRKDVDNYSLYIYTKNSVDDLTWYNESYWQDITNEAKISLLYGEYQSEKEYNNGNDYTSNLVADKCYRIGSLSIGDEVSLTPEVQSGIDCILLPCKAGDVFYIKGTGGAGPRLWGILDASHRLIDMCNEEYHISSGEYVEIYETGYFIYNAQHSFGNELVERLGRDISLYINKCVWLAMGDSITQGYYSYDGGNYAITHNCWATYVKEIKDCTLINKGVGGSGYCGCASSTPNACTQIDSIISSGILSKVDVLTLAYGVNDWKYNGVLGTMESVVGVDNTIISNMRYVIERIISTNPNIKIIVITPINCCEYGEKSSNWGLGYSFSNNGTLDDIFDAEVEVCRYYGIEYIDMTHTSCINRENIKSMLLDNVHPSLQAHKTMGRELSQKIMCY